MKIQKAVQNIGTAHELKRIASAHVIDYRNLTDEELKAAVIKMAPQYYNEGNIRESVNCVFFHQQRHFRIISRLMLSEVLLQQDDFMLRAKETEDQIISFEQYIIDRSNEELDCKSGQRAQALELFQFVLGVAWEHNDSISPDEKNLLEKLKTKLRITGTEYQILEAKLGKYPKPGNSIHTRGEIEEVRRALQQQGLVFSIRDTDATDFDVIPEEIAGPLRTILGLEIRRHGYRELLNYKGVRSKKYYHDILGKCGISFDNAGTMEKLQDIFVHQVRPTVLLGGVSPRDGLDISDLREWCSHLNLQVSGLKEDLIRRIIAYYDSLLLRPHVDGDERELWYEHYAAFASRDLEFLRAQQLIKKDLECEAKFEAATSYLFEKRLGHTPLKMVGTSRADGALSYKDRILYWDNKSKESPVSLRDHIKQFDGYIRSSEKPVAGFLVVAPSFTPDSSALAMQYQVENGMTISLIPAADLKEVADRWAQKSAKGDEDPFPLGYLIQPGFFNKELVAAL